MFKLFGFKDDFTRLFSSVILAGLVHLNWCSTFVGDVCSVGGSILSLIEVWGSPWSVHRPYYYPGIPLQKAHDHSFAGVIFL